MKQLVLVFALVFLFASLSFSQVWTYDSDFLEGPSPHGLVIDADGKIWVGWYAYSDTLGMPEDTIEIAPLWVYNSDGSPAAFSPIRTVTVDAETDTMDSYCRGLSIDNDGNILFVGNQVLYRFNYQTGEGMNKYLYPYASGSLTSAACDDNGYIYVTKVVPGGDPLVVLDTDFELYTFVVDSCNTIQRSLLVNGDGTYVYVPIIYGGTNNNGVIRYYSEDGPDGDYALVDTLYGDVMWAQCGDWDRQGLMWIGTYWDVNPSEWTGWYALDPTQEYGIVDTVGNGYRAPIPDPIPTPEGGNYWSPRHAAWTLDGTTMYTADFDGGVIKKWTNADPVGPGDPIIITSVQKQGDRPIIAVDFRLSQNYPNPFNPTTNIPLDITKSFHVKLVVYNALGQKIATLVDEELTPNHYEFEFDGSSLASGTYYYQVIVNGSAQTKQMLLVK
jgi:sugar lactone lactonase YvrE